MEAILIIFIIICAAHGKGWAVVDPNDVIDHESASALVQGEDEQK